MARSQKDDPRFGDIQHHAWNFRADSAENCAGGLGERPQPASSVINDNMFGGQPAFTANDVYMNKHPYNMGAQSGDNAANKDESTAINNMQQNVNRPNYVMLTLGNGQLVRGYYDENNQRLMIPVKGQYELFNHNQGLRDMPMQSQPLSHMFTLNQEYPVNDNNNMNSVHMAQPISAPPSQSYPKENLNNQSNNVPTSNFLKEVLGNWEPNSSGTYSPFGQNYPLNHPDAPAMNLNPNTVPCLEPQLQGNIVMGKLETSSPKRSDPFADTGTKKRIVAEVKPMRPTYSDVLAKNTKNNTPPEPTRKTKVSNNIDQKSTGKANNTKAEKSSSSAKNINEDSKQKSDSKKLNMTSSGSESGDINTDDTEKRPKPNKKTKNKRNNISRKWSSLDDITKEEDANYNGNSNSQFVFIENHSEKPSKKDKKFNGDNKKHTDKNAALEEDFKLEDEEDDSQYLLNESQTEGKSRKKKERTYGYKASKPSQDKKKTTQSKWRKNKPGYLGKAQAYLEHWGGASWKAVMWFLYLVSDICRMTAHLSFDLCTSVFTQTYVSSQAVWRSSKDWLRRATDNKYLLYIDRKLGHTRLGFWRKLKWFKKEAETDSSGDATKLNANIPLPATGEEAMKRLLACKGKDPYSILGVSVSCTDEEIKRYYRRQAFLVHPDKNQQPGAEEAFKILQHAFDLIGEPERREAYDRRAVESRHVEAAWSELSQLLAQLHDKMEFAANTIRCTNCGRRHKRVLTDRPCYAARYCSQCKIKHSAKEGDIWAESSMMGLLVMYYACMDGAVYQITQWASCQKKNLKQLRPDCHVVQYRIVLGNKAQAANDVGQRPSAGHDPNLEEFLNNLYSKSGAPSSGGANTKPAADPSEAKKRRPKKAKA